MKFRYSKVLFAASLFFSFPVVTTWAASPSDWRISYPRARLFDPATISVRALPNGVRSVCQEAPGTDLVSVQVWVKAGSRYETPENNGVTHLIETLALETSPSSPTSGARAAIEKLGGEASALTARDSMFLSTTVASPFLPETLQALSNAVLHPDLSDARINGAKAAILSEMIAATSDPVRGASDLAYSTSFPRHPYRLTAQGTPVSLRALNSAKVRAYHAARFAGSNISVVVVGDAVRDRVHRLVQQYFGGAARVVSGVQTPADAPPKEVVKTSRQGMLPLTTMTLAWRSPPVTDPADSVALDVLLAHWKEGREPALERVLRTQPLRNGGSDESIQGDEDGNGKSDSPSDSPSDEKSTPSEPSEDQLPLALAFDVDYLTQRESGLFLVTLVAPRERSAAVAALLGEINHIRDDGLTEAQLSRAKFLLTQQYIEQAESVSGLGGALGFYEMIDSYDFAVKYLDRVAKVSNDDIKRLATKYLTTNAYVQATIEGRREERQQDGGGTITASIARQGDKVNG
jgi:zinc protease